MVLPSKNSHTEIVYEHPGDQQNFKYGFEDGSLDAEEGVLSLCATKKCIAQNPYERGYKLGYKKGIQEKGLAGNLVIEPLIDSPGKTVGSDFNGDGIHDFIVGAYVTSSTWVGAAYIFFGASTLSGTKNLK
ncbi:MAG: FG-GAP repeat protein, partial [Deltaproteobacteria bacterium]|nr:FG-GAP repeat protein [Deltaproteobacteria bacterium]